LTTTTLTLPSASGKTARAPKSGAAIGDPVANAIRKIAPASAPKSIETVRKPGADVAMR